MLKIFISFLVFCAALSADVRGFAPLTIAFDAITTPPTKKVKSYSWDFGDGFKTNNKAYQKTFATPGNYSVELKIIYEDGGEIVESVFVSVLEPSDNIDLFIQSNVLAMGEHKAKQSAKQIKIRKHSKVKTVITIPDKASVAKFFKAAVSEYKRGRRFFDAGKFEVAKKYFVSARNNFEDYIIYSSNNIPNQKLVKIAKANMLVINEKLLHIKYRLESQYNSYY